MRGFAVADVIARALDVNLKRTPGHPSARYVFEYNYIFKNWLYYILMKLALLLLC